MFELLLDKTHDRNGLWNSSCRVCPVSAARGCFGIFLRYERWFSHVLGQLGSMEDVHKVCSGLCLQEVKVVYVLQCFFNYKQESV